MRRTGITLIELIVVLAIGAVLMALTLGGVQRVRAEAARASCANNLRQIGIAAQNYHSRRGSLPPGTRRAKEDMAFASWLTRLLPYLDQEPLWAAAQADYKRQPAFWYPEPHPNQTRVVKLFICPADGREMGTNEDGTTAAFTHYLGVKSGPIWHANDGVFFQDSKVRFSDISDGTSQTLLAGERPPDPRSYFCWWYAGIGQDFVKMDGVCDYLMSVREINRTFRLPTCEGGPYHFQDDDPDNECSVLHFWSRHPGGGHFAFCDGSVRFLRYSVDELLPALATRAGGEVVPLD